MDAPRAASAELAANPVPMPLILMIAANADHVQEDAPEPGVSEVCLHNGPIGWNCRLLAIVLVHNLGTFCSRNLAEKRGIFVSAGTPNTKQRRPRLKGRRHGGVGCFSEPGAGRNAAPA